MMMIWLTVLLLFVSCGGGIAVVSAVDDDGTRARLLQGAALQGRGALNEAFEIYRGVLAYEPTNADALHLSGLVEHERGRSVAGIALVRRAIAIHPDGNGGVFQSNLGNLLRSDAGGGDFVSAIAMLREARAIDPRNTGTLLNLALALHDFDRLHEARETMQHVLMLDPSSYDALFWLGSWSRESSVDPDFEGALALFKRALAVAPDVECVAQATLNIGVTQQRLGLLHEAGQSYLRVLEVVGEEDAPGIDDSVKSISDHARLNLGAVHQEAGEMETAIEMYKAYLRRRPEDIMAMNNLGAAQMTIGLTDEGLVTLRTALALEPTSADVLINIGTHLQEEGQLEEAAALYDRAIATRRSDGLRIRKALMLPPVPASRGHLDAARNGFTDRLGGLLKEVEVTVDGEGRRSSPMQLYDPGMEIERIHFYIPYAGYNDRRVQEAVASLYRSVCPTINFTAPGLLQRREQQPRRRGEKVRVGFLSKFFGIHQPHGALLVGVMRHLPRSVFEVVVFSVASPGTPVAPEIVDAADAVYVMPLNMFTVQHELVAADLDVLVFADMLSEPMTYFMGYMRLAPVQVLFWGNPVTSGHGDTIDYFVSSDRMELPARLRSRLGGGPAEETYSEQVVLLHGQGIWYDRPVFPTVWKTRHDFGLDDGDTVYICAQSIFKLHPDFDSAIAGVLAGHPTAKIVFTEGRRKIWTERFLARLGAALSPQQRSRVVVLPRQPGSQAFMQLLATADVMLHPFPFGGSRTSADGLALGMPVVVLPGLFLRGRMAYSFYRTMGVMDCVAVDVADYVAIAVRLGLDPAFHRSVSDRIRATSHRIWEDMGTVREWARFLATAAGAGLPSEVSSASDWGVMTPGSDDPSDAMLEEWAGHPGIAGAVRDYELPAALAAADRTARRTESGEKAAPEERKAWVCGGIGGGGDSRRRELLLHAKASHDSGDLAMAESCLRAALEEDPDNAGVLNDLGAVLQQMWRNVEAVVHFEAALALKPTYALAANNLGVALQALGRLDEAASLYRRVLSGPASASGMGGHVDPSVLFNLGNVLRDQGLYDEATETLAQALQVPPLAEGGAAAAILALADLNTVRAEGGEGVGGGVGRLLQLERQLVVEGHVPASLGPLQEPFHRVVLRLSSPESHQPLNALVALWGILGVLDRSPPSPSLRPHDLLRRLWGPQLFPPPPPYRPEGGEGVHVIVQWYRVDAVERQVQLDLCLLRNLLNPTVESVHVLTEEWTDFARFLGRVREPEWAPNHVIPDGGVADIDPRKLQQTVIGKRMTFRDAFAYANARPALHRKPVALINADIYLDRSLSRLTASSSDLRGRVLALLRWDDLPTGGAALHPRTDSQDTWIFEPPLPEVLARSPDTDFYLGLPRCDNRIARLFLDAGLEVSNPSLAIVSHHVQWLITASGEWGAVGMGGDAGGRAQVQVGGYGGEDQVAGERANVLLSFDPWLL